MYKFINIQYPSHFIYFKNAVFLERKISFQKKFLIPFLQKQYIYIHILFSNSFLGLFIHKVSSFRSFQNLFFPLLPTFASPFLSLLLMLSLMMIMSTLMTPKVIHSVLIDQVYVHQLAIKTMPRHSCVLVMVHRYHQLRRVRVIRREIFLIFQVFFIIINIYI